MFAVIEEKADDRRSRKKKKRVILITVVQYNIIFVLQTGGVYIINIILL